jgi:hypothetical protein
MYKVTRTLPTGQQKEYTCDDLKSVGRHVFYCLYDNCNMNKKEATKHGMEAERKGYTAAAGYTFVVVKE